MLNAKALKLIRVYFTTLHTVFFQQIGIFILNIDFSKNVSMLANRGGSGKYLLKLLKDLHGDILG